MLHLLAVRPPHAFTDGVSLVLATLPGGRGGGGWSPSVCGSRAGIRTQVSRLYPLGPGAAREQPGQGRLTGPGGGGERVRDGT